MSIFQNLLFSFCESDTKQIDDINNFYFQILIFVSSQLSLSTLYFLNSHDQISSKIQSLDYDFIKQSQIDWFVNAFLAQRSAREKNEIDNHFHLFLIFLHIILLEFENRHFNIRNDHWNKSTESFNFNSHFYDVLIKKYISVVNCEHDQVNDFCALLSQKTQQNDDRISQSDSWLCYEDDNEFEKYCSYDKKRFYRRTRIWELDTSIESLKTWKWVEHVMNRIDELILVDNRTTIDIFEKENENKRYVINWNWYRYEMQQKV